MMDPTDPTGEHPNITAQVDDLKNIVLRLFPEAKRIYGGWSLKVENGHRIDLYVMIFNNRITESVEDDWFTVGRYWCYPKIPHGFAPLAVTGWQVAADTEPVGWIKSWDQRYSGEGPVKQRA